MDNKKVHSSIRSSSSRHRSKKRLSVTNNGEPRRVKFKSDISSSGGSYVGHSSNKKAHTPSTSSSTVQHSSKKSSTASNTEPTQTSKTTVSQQVTSTTTTPTDTVDIVSNFQSRPKSIIQSVRLVWLYEDIDEKQESFQKCVTEFRKIVFTVQYFTDTSRCIEYLKSIKQDSIFLIVSGLLGQKMVPLIHGMTQVDTIIVFTLNEDLHKIWAQKWSKIAGIFHSRKSVCQALTEAKRTYDQNNIAISIVSKQIVSDVASQQQNLDQLPSDYMYSLLLKDLILDISEEDTSSIDDLIHYCRKQGIVESELSYFQREYRKKSALWWYYSTNIFLHGMIGKVLQFSDMEMLRKLSFFIRNLHRELEKLHEQQLSIFKNEFVVYRGQGFTQQDFQCLLDNKDGLVSFNNFLSTNTEKQVAMNFATNSINKKSDMIGVLFTMKVDPSKISTTRIPYALIDSYSSISSEQEVLFTMHTVFRIIDIKQTSKNNRIWRVQLAIIDDDDSEMIALTSHINSEVEDSIGWCKIGKLMQKIGQLQQAEQFYNELLQNAKSDSEKEHIYYQLACLKSNQNEYEEAAKWYEKSIETKRKVVPEDDVSLATTYSNIGQMYNKMGDYSKALEYYENAQKIDEKVLPLNHLDLACLYNNIGLMHGSMGDYLKALEFYKKASEIFGETLPSNHSDLADFYSNVGKVYQEMSDYPKAFEFYEKLVEIQEKVLSPNHPSLAAIYNNVGLVCYRMGNYFKALEFYQKSLKIKEQSVPPNDPDLATSYYSIGQSYNSMNDYSKAIEYYEKSIEIKEKSLPPYHPDLATLYNNIGGVYQDIGIHSKALEFYEKSHKIFEKSLPPNHSDLDLDLAISYDKIGQVYHNMNDYLKALEFYEKSCKLLEETLPLNRLSLASSYNDVGLLYKDMGNYSQALEFYEKSIKIKEDALPPDHMDLATSYNNMGIVYNCMGKRSEAIKYYEKSIGIKENSVPLNYLSLATSYNNIGGVYQDMGKWLKAFEFYEKSHEILENALPLNHPSFATYYNNIGGVYRDMGNCLRALEFYEKSLKIKEATLPLNHQSFAASYWNMGNIYSKLDDYSKALIFLEKALRIYEMSLPSTHPNIKNVMTSIAIVKKKL